MTPSKMTHTPRERIAFPLDVADLAAASHWLDRLSSSVGVFKVGLELFTAFGPQAIAVTGDNDCFLDLKLHDIPATMAGAAAAAATLGVRYLTIHAAAGPDALRATREAIAGSDTQLLAVTVLTSLDKSALAAIGVPNTPAQQAVALARMAADVGIDGFVCSPAEVSLLRAALPQATLVTPGIRPASAAADDQKRKATPEEALQAGSDVLVVGRPIRLAADPEGVAASLHRTISHFP